MKKRICKKCSVDISNRPKYSIVCEKHSPKKRIEKECHREDCLNMTKNNKYCSRTCSVIVNNKIDGRKRMGRKKRNCKICNLDITYLGADKNSMRKLCDPCLEISRRRTKYNENITFGSLKKRLSNKYHYSSVITRKAREKYTRSGLEKRCFICGYDKVIEVCHIRPVSSFEDTNTVSEINSINNLVALCPNHHSEFDRKIMDKKLVNIIIKKK